jgi:hypothetical protein
VGEYCRLKYRTTVALSVVLLVAVLLADAVAKASACIAQAGKNR